MNFSQLKTELGIGSSGNLNHHLKKLGDLIVLDSDGLCKISDDGKEALKAAKSLESSFNTREAYPVAQSRKILGVILMLLAIFILAVTTMAVALTPSNMTSTRIVGLLGGLIDSIVGMLGAASGLKRAIVSDGKSSSELTFFPSKKDPWTIQDWVVHLFFLSSCLTLTFLLVYAQIFSTDFLHRPLWFAASILSLSTLTITSLLTSYRIIEKANQKIERSV